MIVNSKLSIYGLSWVMILLKKKVHELTESISKGEEITFEKFEPIMRKGLGSHRRRL